MVAIVREDLAGLVGPVIRADRSDRRCSATVDPSGPMEIPAMAPDGFFGMSLLVRPGIQNARLSRNTAFVGDHRPLHPMVVALVMLVLVTP